MAERALVTGASGCIGRQVLAPLAALGFEVHAVARRPGPGGAIWHAADLLDEAAQRRLLGDIRPALLVHAAWYVEHGRFWTAPENADWLDASTALAAHFAEAGGRRFLGIGSCAEYAEAAPGDGAPWPELRPIAPATPYGAAKAALAARLAEHPGTAWARLFHLFGPGEAAGRLIPSVVAALREGQEARCGSGRPVRDFAGSGYIGRALAALAASPVTGAVNIGSGEARSIRALVETLARLAGRPELPRFGALPDRPGEVAFQVAEVTRLRREVGFAEPPRLEADLALLLRACEEIELAKERPLKS